LFTNIFIFSCFETKYWVFDLFISGPLLFLLWEEAFDISSKLLLFFNDLIILFCWIFDILFPAILEFSWLLFKFNCSEAFLFKELSLTFVANLFLKSVELTDDLSSSFSGSSS
jgi:hypothetical protein